MAYKHTRKRDDSAVNDQLFEHGHLQPEGLAVYLDLNTTNSCANASATARVTWAGMDFCVKSEELLQM